MGRADGAMAWATIAEASAALRAKKISPLELTRLCLERIQLLNGRLNAFITVTEDAALQQAKALESEARGAGVARSMEFLSP